MDKPAKIISQDKPVPEGGNQRVKGVFDINRVGIHGGIGFFIIQMNYHLYLVKIAVVHVAPPVGAAHKMLTMAEFITDFAFEVELIRDGKVIFCHKSRIPEGFPQRGSSLAGQKFAGGIGPQILFGGADDQGAGSDQRQKLVGIENKLFGRDIL